MSRHRHRPDHIRKNDVSIAVIRVGLLIVVLLVIFLLLRYWENFSFHVDSTYENQGIQEAELKTLHYDGKTYRQRENLETYLFLGIDVEGPVKAVNSYYGGGQADVQMVVVVDHENKTWEMLQINRDTMVLVPVLGVKGDVIGSEYEQIALSHAYGNGLKESCENSVKTVSNLLKGQKIDGYLSMNMDGVAIVNDAVGGVPIEITSDFSAVDEELPLGETVTLQGTQALTFVRARKDVDDQTNIARMGRQRQYLSALLNKIGTLDDQEIIRTYDALQDYVVTDMGSKTLLNLSEEINEYEFSGVLTIDGEAKVENGHWAYYLDKESLLETIIELFYQ